MKNKNFPHDFDPAARSAPMKSKLQTAQHARFRAFLRLAGPVLAALGFVLLLAGIVSFFSALGTEGPPRFFWCAFVGMPLLFIGGVMCMFGYMGAITRYAAAEQVPVATDAITDLAEGTQGAVRTMTRAAAEGLRDAQKPPSAAPRQSDDG